SSFYSPGAFQPLSVEGGSSANGHGSEAGGYPNGSLAGNSDNNNNSGSGPNGHSLAAPGPNGQAPVPVPVRAAPKSSTSFYPVCGGIGESKERTVPQLPWTRRREGGSE
ncbi:unnamed protein product, partial [Polarella glacialis]